jgi:hypothetical protein
MESRSACWPAPRRPRTSSRKCFYSYGATRRLLTLIVEGLHPGVLVGLPQDQRKALEMAFFEGMTHTEIAGKTGEPLGTVKTRIRTGLLALRKVLA